MSESLCNHCTVASCLGCPSGEGVANSMWRYLLRHRVRSYHCPYHIASLSLCHFEYSCLLVSYVSHSRELLQGLFVCVNYPLFVSFAFNLYSIFLCIYVLICQVQKLSNSHSSRNQKTKHKPSFSCRMFECLSEVICRYYIRDGLSYFLPTLIFAWIVCDETFSLEISKLAADGGKVKIYRARMLATDAQTEDEIIDVFASYRTPCCIRSHFMN